MIIRELGMTVFGLLCGSILFGRALPKWIKGIDVTEVSNDHNPGTANAMKYAGVPVGILCLLGDLLKGALPVYVAIGMGLVTDIWFRLSWRHRYWGTPIPCFIMEMEAKPLRYPSAC